MTWHKRFASRLRALFRKHSLEEELDEELRLHLAMQTEDYIENGMSPEEARRETRSSFGGLDQVKEECRDRWSFLWLDTLWRDLGYAVRTLRKSPGFTTVAILSLALGIGATTAIFTAINAIVLRPPAFKDPERLVLITEASGQDDDGHDRPKDRYRFAWREQSELLESIAAADYYGTGVTLVQGTAGEFLAMSRGGADIFRVLGVEPLLGRTFLPEDFRLAGATGFADAVVLSHRLWVRRFDADPNIVGKPLPIVEMGNPIIIGVMPPGTWVFPWQLAKRSSVDMWTAVDWTKRSQSQSRWLHAIGRLKQGVTVEQAREELELIARRRDEADGVEQGGPINVQPLETWLTYEARPGSSRNRPYREDLYLLFGAVGFVLLIACTNVANLCLGRALKRSKEMVTRAALGAGRGRLVRQLLTESVLLSAAAGTAGILFAYAGVRLFAYLAPNYYPGENAYRIDFAVLGFTIGISLMTGVVFGLAPALRAGRVNLNDVLKEGSRRGTGMARGRLSALLVVTQVALAVVLLVGAGLMVNTLINLTNAPLSFNPDRLIGVYIHLKGPRYEVKGDPNRKVTPNVEFFFREAMRKIEALPGVKSVGVGRLPTEGWGDYRFRVLGRPESPEDEEPRSRLREVSDNYFRVAEIPLLRGRHFTQRDTAGATGVAIINKTLADSFFPAQDPLGQVLQVTLKGPYSETSRRVPDRPRTIVGVVGDSFYKRLTKGPRPEMYYPMSQHLWDYPGGGFHRLHTRNGILVRTHVEPATLQQAIRQAIAETDPNQVPGVRTMAQRLASTYGTQRFWLQLLGLFSGLALLLAAIGLYGVISYSVTQRTHEFGIRMALGAERSNVLRVVLSDGLRLSLIGIAIGLVAALGLTRLIESQLYGVTPTDPATFTAVAAVLLAVALLASYVPARRATKVDPMQALRYE